MWTAPYTFTAGETLTAAKLNEQVRDNWNAAFPVGSLHWRMQAATSVETTIDGFCLEGNGVSVLRASYSNLNTKLGALSYPFGTADGTHMTLPDLSGRKPTAMAASGHADVNALGKSDGLAKASRAPRPTVSIGFSVSVTISGTTDPANATGVDNWPQAGSVYTGTHSHGFSGSGSGSGSGSDTADVPYLVVGVMGVKY